MIMENLCTVYNLSVVHQDPTCRPLPLGLADGIYLHYGPIVFTVVLALVIMSPYAILEVLRKITGIDIVQEIIDNLTRKS
jgi:hypothetical protein